MEKVSLNTKELVMEIEGRGWILFVLWSGIDSMRFAESSSRCLAVSPHHFHIPATWNQAVCIFMITFMYIQKVKDITLKKFFLILIFNSLLYLGIIIYF